MSRALDMLSPTFRPKAFELLARLTEVGLIVMIIDTARTPEEQQAAVARGASKTSFSKHVIVPGRWDYSDAIDVCPYELYQLHGPDKLRWNANDGAWAKLGEIGKKLGLRWGGDWRNPGEANFWTHRPPHEVDPYDPGHFELPGPMHVH